MAQHFLLTAEARSFSLMKIMRLTDKEAFDLFKQARWSETGGEPVCPVCGSMENHWMEGVKRWKCRGCRKQFSVTSGTLFAYHKKPLQVYLAAIAIFSNAAKGISALQLSRDLDVQYKTAFVLAHKIRDSLMHSRDESPMDGEVEVDGVYTGHYIRPANKIEDRVDRRKVHKPNKRVVISFRQRADGTCEVVGAKRTVTYVLNSENEKEIKELSNLTIRKGSTVHADEANAYDGLHAHYRMKRVNHQVEYMSEDGACNNQAESFNARFRRMQYGQMHRLGNLYLSNYANEIAYREDTRRWSNGRIFRDVVVKCASMETSNEWCGYWQGNHRVAERIGA